MPEIAELIENMIENEKPDASIPTGDEGDDAMPTEPEDYSPEDAEEGE